MKPHYHAFYAVQADARGCVAYYRINTAHKHRTSARRVAEKMLDEVNARIFPYQHIEYADGVITRSCENPECVDGILP